MVFGLFKAGYQKVTTALKKAGSHLGSKVRNLIKGTINDEVLEELEEILYEADLGVKTTTELVEHIREKHQNNPKADAETVLTEMRDYLLGILDSVPEPDTSTHQTGTPQVILIVGVNGNGKTTSIAKLAHRFQSEGKKVLLGAADTFRAAAVDQLTNWADRVGADIVKGQPQADPAAVAYDTVTAGLSRHMDIVMIDTAGRLHTKTDLMHELEKIKRSSNKVLDGAPHETYLVLDATTGQNAVDQAKTFHQFTPITGLILTKLDGTAKGGIIVAIQRELGIPVRYIGVGEGMDDLQKFEPKAFVEALLT